MAFSFANNLRISSPLCLSSSSSPDRRRRMLPLSAHHRTRLFLSSNPSKKPKTPRSLIPLVKSLSSKTLTLVSIAGGSFFLVQFLGSGGGSGVPPGGGGGGDDGGGGGFWFRFFRIHSAMAAEDERSKKQWDMHGLPPDIVVPLDKLSKVKRYMVSELTFYDRSFHDYVNQRRDSFLEMVTLRPGRVYTKGDLFKEFRALATSGMFSTLTLDITTKADGTLSLKLSFTPASWRHADRFRCINVGLMKPPKPIESDPDLTDSEKMELYRKMDAQYQSRIAKSRPCLLPESLSNKISKMMYERDSVSARFLQTMRDMVHKWYHEEGYACAQVVNFGNLNTKTLVCEVVEGDITKLDIQFLDKLGNLCEGNTHLSVIKREIPRQLFPGHIFNIEAGKQALRNINSLGLFSNIEVNPKPDEFSEGGIIVELKLRELDQKSAELNTEWSIVPGRNGRPTLASLQPGGTVTIEHRNIKGLNRSVSASINTSNLLNPQDDLSYKFEYVHPNLDGMYSSRNRTFRTSCFNSRKLSPVFTGGPGADEVPAIWVDRAGIKANITESLTRQSKLTYGLVLEEITTRDETSSICTSGSRALPSGGLSIDGPPTTLSGTGVDRMAFLQANITRDNTKFVNGTIVGERNIFQLDQGLGIGSNFPFFNRHQFTVTRFIPLRDVEEGAGNPPPPVLVLHGHYGGCVGDLPSYDAFTLGGPYSVRGYNMGEIGAARNILEVAAELRIPIKKTQVYGFVEHGNDLWSSKDVKGNPTEFFRRAGFGSSYGAGVKVGLVRAEYAVDHNSGTGALFFRFGERF